MSPADREPAWLRRLAVIGCLAFALPLAAHAYAGTASRYVGDDYCAGYIFHDYGLIGGQIWHYKSWSAVPTTLLLMALTEPGGARLAPLLPGAALALWLLAGTWTVHEISSGRWSRSPWSWAVCVFLAEVLIFATLQDAPNVAQSVYLRVPMLAYMCPLIVLTAHIGWLVRAVNRGSRHVWAMAVSASFAVVFGAFGPVCAALLTVATCLGAFVAWLECPEPRRSMLVRLLVWGSVGSIVALAIVALAPGNATRQLQFPQPPGLFKVGIWSVLYAGFMFVRPVVAFLQPAIVWAVPHAIGETPRWLPTALEMGTSPIPLAIAMMIPAIVAVVLHRREPATDALARARWWIPAAAFVLVCACMAPGAYGTSAPPPPRALLIPQYVITSLAACWACAMALAFAASRGIGTPSSRLMASVVVGCAILVGPVAATPGIVRTGSLMRQWARQWDDADRQLRLAQARGVRDVTVPALDRVAGVGSITSDAHDWVNICASHYYGLRSITGSAPQ
jgi:hypothetical protein